MDTTGVVERVQHITAVRSNPAADVDILKSGLVAIREVRAWCDAQQAGIVRSLNAVDSFPEKTVAEANKQSLGQAAKSTERSNTLGKTPKLADALDDGAITAEHVDAVSRTARKLDADKRDTFIERADALTDVAAAGNVNDFARRLELEAKRLEEDDGIDRLARQRRNVRARSWVDLDGMWNLTVTFDPVTGVRVAARIDAMMQALFADQVPDECPDDPIEKQRYLAARAVAEMLLDEALGGHPDVSVDDANDASGDADLPRTRPTRPKPGKPEFVVVIDADAPDHVGPVAEFSIPVEIPARVLAALAGDADTHTVVVRNGVVLYAPGELNLGRTTRLANRAQRRALRGVYTGCGIPGCSVAYDRCKLHHIIWWSNGGSTDLENLLPVCSHHHAKIHHDGWIIELGPNRELTLRLPDGSVHTTGPPGRAGRRRPAA
jgi:hypothetical protein